MMREHKNAAVRARKIKSLQQKTFVFIQQSQSSKTYHGYNSACIKLRGKTIGQLRGTDIIEDMKDLTNIEEISRENST